MEGIKWRTSVSCICISNTGYRVSLTVGTRYVVVDSSDVESLGLVRIIDDNREEYMYPSKLFVLRNVGIETALPSGLR